MAREWMAMRRGDVPSGDTIEVRRGSVHGVEAPEQFVWHSRLWLVHEVQGHWTECGGWGGTDAGSETGTEAGTRPATPLGTPPPAREVWRVDAASGRDGFHAGVGSGRRGVFDLVLERSDGADSTWRLQAPAGHRG